LGLGKSVAISDDTIIVAGDHTIAEVFVRTETGWEHQAAIEGSNTAHRQEWVGQDIIVAISNDTIVIGDKGDNSNATGVNGDHNDLSHGSGAAFVFIREEGNWFQQAYLKASNTEVMDPLGSQDHFGYSVAISGDTIVVGSGDDSDAIGVNGDQHNNYALSSGAAYVFERAGTNWRQQAYLKASNTSIFSQFGRFVAISNDLIVVSGTKQTYVFQEKEAWKQVALLQKPSQAFSGNTVYAKRIIYSLNPNDFIETPIEPTQISGFAWLDNNSNGLQDVGEPGLVQAVSGIDRLSFTLYRRLPYSNDIEKEPFKVVSLGKDSRYVFENILSGNYYLCASKDFVDYNLSVTRANAGDDAIDSDFDFSPCTLLTVGKLDSRQNQFDLGFTGESINPIDPANPVAGNQVKGFVWLDNNGDGLQNPGEPGLTQRAQGLGATSIALYPDGSINPVDVVFLDENSRGHYAFTNVVAGNYYICASSDFLGLGLTVTTQDAGDDAIDSDFDSDPCAYNITVSDTQGFDVDLGLVGGPLDPAPNGNLNEITVKTNTLLINHQWRLANNLGDSSDSVAFFSAPSNNGAQRGVVRMKRTDNSTQFKFQEWSNLDSFHTNETINIVSIPQGNWNAGNTQIEVGRSDLNGTGQWKTIHFATTFSTPPAVILSLQTANGGDAVDVHVRNITTGSMQVALYEEERGMSSGHLTETVGYLLVSSDSAAFDLGNADSTHIELPFQTTGVQVNHNWKTIGAGYQVRLEEDQTRDQETFHTNETVHVIKVNDFYLTQIASAVGGNPSVLRSRQ
jgi:hypothetical protein